METITDRTPAELGYRMPAEWEPHTATWLSWPRNEGISYPDDFDNISRYWVKMCELLCKHETVHINTFDESHREQIRARLTKDGLEKQIGSRIQLHSFPAYEPWCRDHGPVFLVNEDEPRLAAVHWKYNAWGDKYPPYDLENEIPHHIAKHLGIPLFEPGIVLEGGSIEVNGAGTVLTTTACLLNPNRNPHLSKEQIEQKLKEYLGVVQVAWIGDGIEGDDTDGHIDDITRFVGPRTIVTCVEDDPEDPNFQPLLENYEKLLLMRAPDGQPFKVISLPMPGRVEHEGKRLPASYANFYIGNKTVIVPIYGHPNDSEALVTLRELFPGREVYGMISDDLVYGLGAFHCVTQQQPKV